MNREVSLVLACALVAACRGEKDPIIARVGKLKISQAEFQRKLSEVSQGYQDYVLSPSGRRQFLDVLIREKLILAAAQQSDLPRSSEYRAALDKMRREEDERLREGGEYLLTTMWVEELRRRGTLKVDESMVTEYLAKHPYEVEMRHVLMGSPEAAADIAKRLRSGANFAKVAKDESLDGATSADGGKLPSSLYGEVIPELEEVVFRMRVGEIAGPLKSKFGYHVLRKDGEKKVTHEEGLPRVLRLLEKQQLDAYLQSIQDKFPVEVLLE
ncbi:MAG: peptidylprolyl isomerase [Elusimicrobiota bacterium]